MASFNLMHGPRRVLSSPNRIVDFKQHRAEASSQICILAWAILRLIVVAILLRFSGRRDERGRENRN
jgi:hypothetical protein